MIQIRMHSMRCDRETRDVSDSDEPYILVAAVQLAPAMPARPGVPFFQPEEAHDVVLYAFGNIDEGKSVWGGAEQQFDSFWGIGGIPSAILDPDRAIFIVAFMENDSADPHRVRGTVDLGVTASLGQSLRLTRPAKVNTLFRDVDSARRGLTGLGGEVFADEAIGGLQELRFSLDEMQRAEAGQTVKKTMVFAGDGGQYTIEFEALNSALAFNSLLLAWKGAAADERLFFNNFTDAQNFVPQQVVRGDVGTSHRPAMAIFNNKLFMAWKGMGDDPRIFFSSSSDGLTFGDQQLVRGVGTSHGPALAELHGGLFMAWKGMGDDPRIFFSSSSDGLTFNEQLVVPGTGGTSRGPAITMLPKAY
jgi:hypothetical protein